MMSFIEVIDSENPVRCISVKSQRSPAMTSNLVDLPSPS